MLASSTCKLFKIACKKAGNKLGEELSYYVNLACTHCIHHLKIHIYTCIILLPQIRRVTEVVWVCRHCLHTEGWKWHTCGMHIHHYTQQEVKSTNVKLQRSIEQGSHNKIRHTVRLDTKF